MSGARGRMEVPEGGVAPYPLSAPPPIIEHMFERGGLSGVSGVSGVPDVPGGPGRGAGRDGSGRGRDGAGPGRRPRYAELHAHSAYSFLDGASMPEELVSEASRLGLEALALTDHDGLPGVVRFAEAARVAGLPTVIGAELGLGSTGRTGPPGDDGRGYEAPTLPMPPLGAGGGGAPGSGWTSGAGGGRGDGRGEGRGGGWGDDQRGAQDDGGFPFPPPRTDRGTPRGGAARRRAPGTGASGFGPGTGMGTGTTSSGTSAAPPRGRRDPDGSHLLVLARGPEGYRRLSRAIGEALLASGTKGVAAYDLADLAARAGGPNGGEWLVLTGCRKGTVRRALEPVHGGSPATWDVAAARRELDRLVALFGTDNVAVEVTDLGHPLDATRNDVLAEMARAARLPLVATGNVHAARPGDQPVADVLAATRARASLEELDGWLPPVPAHLRSAAEMLARHARHPQAVTTAADLAEECRFDLRLVAPNLPPHPVPAGHTEESWLRELTYRGARRCYGPCPTDPSRGVADRGDGAHLGISAVDPREAWRLIDHELAVICELGFPGYFLIVHEIVEFCRRRGILCQGRGSAANSAVCFTLGITAVDAVRHRMLFERFLSPGRSGPPDIDMDIESGRREEVIQFVYERYGRRYAAQVANVISYRPRSAVRDVARALGYDVGQADAWSKGIERWGSLRGATTVPVGPSTDGAPGTTGPLIPVGTPEPTSGPLPVPASRASRATSTVPVPVRDWHAPPPADGVGEIPDPVVDLAERLLRLPRHLGIHSGGMVLCDRPVLDVCPVAWATMPGRTVLQWDKDDCADAGLVKFDLLGLGMLTALRLAFETCARTDPPGTFRDAAGGPIELGLHTLPQDDPAVYDLLCAADTVGVFQVESRAQMSTLPRLRPRVFYDIVVEVALIRPGPIQGDSVNPYLARRTGREPVTYLHPLLEPALGKTLGVPLFQEQLMQIAIDVAGFSPAEADQLRKAMGSKRSTERMEALHQRFLDGVARNGIDAPTGEAIFEKLRAFSDFGFPESHSFSFAYLVYASAWLKVHRPEAFYAGILAAQPMGFYSPQSLVADARRHGVRVLPADVARSGVHARVEETPSSDVPGADEVDGARVEPGLAALVRPRADLAVRLGLAPVRSVGEETAAALAAERDARGPFRDLADLAARVDLSTEQLEALATAGALDSFGRPRREALWAAGALGGEYGTTHGGRRRRRGGAAAGGGAGRGPTGSGGRDDARAPGADRELVGGLPVRSVGGRGRAYLPAGMSGAAGPAGRAPQALTPRWVQPPLPGTAVGLDAPELPGMDAVERSVADVWATGVTIDTFPTQFHRADLDAAGVLTVAALACAEHGSRLRVAGVVTHRQRPHTARGITFLSLEDETGMLNVVVSAGVWVRHQKVARRSAALVVRGIVERIDGVTNLVADRLERLDLQVPSRSRDFR